ncbi:hypothetical protein EBR11_07635, partial [bacterium]|nr:hypothetical protein [bacterium]
MSTVSTKLSQRWTFFFGFGLLALAVTWFFAYQGIHGHDHRPALSVLVGCLFWVSILIGMLMLTMITRVFDAGWAPIIRRSWEFMIG